MTGLQRKIIASVGIVVEIVALILMSIGLYIRFAGAGNPVGSAYIFVGGIVAIGGGIVALLLVYRRK